MSEIRAKLRQVIQAGKFAALSLPGIGDVKVRVLTVADVQSSVGKSASSTPMANMIAEHLCDAQERRIYNPESAADIAEIQDLPIHISNRIIAAINGGGSPAEQQEAAAKNSLPSAGSSSD